MEKGKKRKENETVGIAGTVSKQNKGLGRVIKKKEEKIWQTLLIRNAQRPVCTKSRVIKRVVTPGRNLEKL